MSPIQIDVLLLFVVGYPSLYNKESMELHLILFPGKSTRRNAKKQMVE
jgi:hypothetical protein